MNPGLQLDRGSEALVALHSSWSIDNSHLEDVFKRKSNTCSYQEERIKKLREYVSHIVSVYTEI